MIEQVGIIGAGTMGNGIAQVCAAARLSVVMVDISDPRRGRHRSACPQSANLGALVGSHRAACISLRDDRSHQAVYGRLASS